MKRKPNPHDDFDTWEAEMRRLCRKRKRIHRQALIERMRARRERVPEPALDTGGPWLRVEDLFTWPRPDNPDARLSEEAAKRRQAN